MTSFVLRRTIIYRDCEDFTPFCFTIDTLAG